MSEAGTGTFWDRLAARSQQTGSFVGIEQPTTIVRIWTLILWASVAFVWLGAASFFRYQEPTAGWILAALGVSYAVAWVVYAVTGSVRGPVVMLVVMSALANTSIHIALGGYANSGSILMWAVALTLVAGVVLERYATIVIAAAFIVEGVVFAFLEQSLQASRPQPDPALPSLMFAIVLVGTLLVVTPLIASLLNRVSFERKRAEDLLSNVLPGQVAAELKQTGKVAARRFESVSVLFVDIVGFTPMSEDLSPEELVEQLNAVFTFFDTLTTDHGCEKIRTIGDAYMVAAGVPQQRDDHAHALATVALAMREYAAKGPMTFRIGINSGPVVAGVIGTTKFQYDVWGDTVNTASRMESHAEPGTIQVSQATYELIKDDYRCVRRGPIEVKGKGMLETWFLKDGKS
ncbi:MAG: adenylate/guanylate cyclase domain-containing protein [Actinomycetota bacterium]